MFCPYCNGPMKEVSREENIQNTDANIEIIFKCKTCGKEPSAILEFEGFYDEDGHPIMGL